MHSQTSVNLSVRIQNVTTSITLQVYSRSGISPEAPEPRMRQKCTIIWCLATIFPNSPRLRCYPVHRFAYSAVRLVIPRFPRPWYQAWWDSGPC